MTFDLHVLLLLYILEPSYSLYRCVCIYCISLRRYCQIVTMPLHDVIYTTIEIYTCNCEVIYSKHVPLVRD